MKRKLLSLLLCIAVCIPFILTSCISPDLWQQQENKEKTFIDDILCTWEKDEAYDSASSFVPEGVVAGSNEKFVYTVGTDYSDESVGLLADKTNYRVYNIASGALVFEDSVIFDLSSQSYTTEAKSVSITLLDKMVFVIKANAETGMETAFFYDENGNELLKTEDTALTIIDSDRVILNHKLYVLKDGALELKKNLKNASLLASIVDDLKFVGDRYVYIDAYAVAYVFDENYDFLFEKSLKQTQGSTFANEQYNYFTLSNGNVIFQTTYSVGNYSAELEPYMYDFISGGKCYRLDSYLLDIRAESYKGIELSYILSTVLPVGTSSDGFSLPYGAQNIGVGQKIDAKKLVSTNGSTYASFLLYDNGSTKGMPGVDGNANITVISENRFIAETDFSVKVYDENATLIGMLDSYADYNNKFIVTGTEILDHDLKVVYSLVDNNAAVDFLTCDSVIVTSFNDETRTSTKYLITNAGEPKVISSEAELIVRDSFYATVETADGASKLTIYKTNGDKISELSIDNSTVAYNDFNGYTILEAKSIEGKTMYITVFKAVAN